MRPKPELTSVDNGGSHQDTSSTTQSTHHVGDDRQQTKGSTSKSGSSGNDPLELLVDGGISVSGKSHSLVLELLGDVSGSRAGYFDPGLGEDGAGSDDKGHVDDGVEGVGESHTEGSRSRDVVRDTRDGRKLRGRVLKGLDISKARCSDQ